MTTCIDICKRSLYMNLFIIPIPLIAYMIHNGSSAMVALVWYILLSLCIPWAYVSYATSTFGTGSGHINKWIYFLSWLIVQGLTYGLAQYGVDLSPLWELPTIARDIVFFCGMYGQVTLALIIAYAGSNILGGAHE